MPPRLLPRLLSGAVYFSSRSTAIFRLPLIQYCANGRSLSNHVVNNVRQFRIAIIGSGPAGFYAAYKIFGKIDGAKVDMFERLPVPFGLVRFGVAPDHPEVKVRPFQSFMLWYLFRMGEGFGRIYVERVLELSRQIYRGRLITKFQIHWQRECRDGDLAAENGGVV